MTDHGERYDGVAHAYARWWAPVLAPTVAELVDEIRPHLTEPDLILDVGTGTGQLALLALARWPAARVVGIDASAGMLTLAEAAADAALEPADRSRFEIQRTLAETLPFEEGRFDLALSSYVVQLVSNRARVLREVRRILRPGGLFAYVCWLEDDGRFVPDQVFGEVLGELGLERHLVDGRSGDIPSVARAVGELRRAGFAGASARPGELIHRFTVESYVSFLTEFDEETYFDELKPEVRVRLIDRLRRRLDDLSTDEMTMRFPIVFALGRRSR